ncbi:MBL fold metallo-hydrolase [Herbiconiux liukaitaii]|uniref:MBL fold metallo-hydrolase n=1 Tax=Herbiconiux liukaitaii TaxID=3342799 RepID=UPI0035B7C6F1
MRIETINVGDGACAVASDTDKTTDLTMIDCGRWRRGDRDAASRAANYLGERLGEVTTLVVTHFDRDHWGGLLELAATHETRRPNNSPPVEIRIPGMPDTFAADLRAGMLALISSRDGTPVNAIELLDAWQATNIGVRQTVQYAGDEFEANGLEWKVLWPPHQIPPEMGSRIITWLKDLNQLAHEMESAGHGKLLDDLRRAYAEVERFDTAVDRKEPCPDAPTWSSLPETRIAEHTADDHPRLDTVEPVPADTEFVSAPAAFKKDLAKLAARMGALDNALSLVIATKAGDFINFGDIEGDALEALLLSGKVESEYPVMFAPHHGTHEAPYLLPKSGVCISQNGTDHHKKNLNHRRTHVTYCRCISTWDHGNIDLETEWRGVWPNPWW